MAWFGIRTVYLFQARADGINIFEERVVCFEAATAAEAHEKAYAERQTFAENCGFTAHPQQEGYEQDGDQLIDGYEVWSELYESTDTLEAFYEKRYSKFKRLEALG